MEDDDERSDTKSLSDYNNDEALDEIQQLAKSLTSKNIVEIAVEEKFTAQELLQKIISYLTRDHNTDFLSDYLKLLKVNNGEHSDKRLSLATAEIMTIIKTKMIKEAAELQIRREAGVVVASWLGAAVLWDSPLVPSAHEALIALLPLLTHTQTMYLATMWETLLLPGSLLQLSDAIPGTKLAGLLLRAALIRLLRLTTEEPNIPNSKDAPVTPEDVAAVFQATKRALTSLRGPQSVERQSYGMAMLMLVRMWGRARALAGRGAELSVRGLKEVCLPLDMFQVHLALLRFHILFDYSERPELESQGTSTATREIESDEETLFSV